MAQTNNDLKMTKQNLEKEIKEMTIKLLEIARMQTWNSISDNCVYLLSEIQDTKTNNFIEIRKRRNQQNEKKHPKSFNHIITELKNLYDDLYDVNLFIYKALPKQTIVEIRYFLKSSFDREYFEQVKNNEPMLHSKVAIPPYLYNDEEKFDINWKFDELKIQEKIQVASERYQQKIGIKKQKKKHGKIYNGEFFHKTTIKPIVPI